MKLGFLLLRGCCFLFAFLVIALTLTAEEKTLLGFSRDHATQERLRETKFDSYLTSQNIKSWIKTLSARPHHVGSIGGKLNAEFIAKLFRSWGYETQIETFYVLFPTPKTRILEITSAGVVYRPSLAEPPIPNDASSSYVNEQLPIYYAYSKDGDVTAPLVYVNYGLHSDYQELAKYGIDVRGKIVLARDGGAWRGAKAKVAAEYGAIGCIVYSDPAGDGYYWGDVYPKGGWRNERSAQRGSTIDFTEHNGDPLTPSMPAFKDTKRIPISQSNSITKIPVLPISYGDAIPILQALRGPIAPEEWRGALPLPYHLGAGPAVAHLKLEFAWDIRPVYNVLARMRGTMYPDQWIMRGNHHDAWVYGATDPVSGIASLLEEARGVAELTKTGWRPKRTILYAAWDGEEGGLLGSTEWVEAHLQEIQQKVIAYINSDSNSRGFLFFQGSATLEEFVNEIAGDVTDPEKNVSVLERARAYRVLNGPFAEEARERKDLRIQPAGSGSDYSSFLQHAGIASLDLGFGNEDEYGQYHSIYDHFDHYRRFGDPGFEYGVALAKVGGRCMLRMSEADLLPFHFTAFAENVSRSLQRLQQMMDQKNEEIAEENRRIRDGTYQVYFDPTLHMVVPAAKNPLPNLNFAPLSAAIDRLKKASVAYEQNLPVDQKALEHANALLQGIEQRLTRKEGLPGRAWFTHQLVAPTADGGAFARLFPGIGAAIDHNEWKVAEEQIRVVAETIDRFTQQIQRVSIRNHR